MMKKTGTVAEATPQKVVNSEPRLNVIPLSMNCLPHEQAKAEDPTFWICRERHSSDLAERDRPALLHLDGFLGRSSC